MRILILAIVMTLTFVAIAHADFLTATPTGLGKIAINSSLTSTTYNSSAWSGINVYDTTVQIVYGATDMMDLLAGIGYETYSGLPSGSSVNATLYGVTCKYTFIKEDKEIPVSLAGIANYKNLNASSKGPTYSSTANASDISGGLLVSKVNDYLIPYGGVSYHTYSTTGYNDSRIQGNLGCTITINPALAIMAEYNYYSINTANSPALIGSVFGFGINYKI